jgi:hypothetical protein
MERAQVGFPHQPRDAMLAAGLSGFTQIEEDAGAPLARRTSAMALLTAMSSGTLTRDS